MKKVLVTGGAGYIGSHTVVELINAGYEPIIVDNLVNSKELVLDRILKITGVKPKFYKVNLCDYDALEEVFKKEKFNDVIHFAGLKAVGESVKIPLRYYANNIDSTLNLLDLMIKYDVKNIVFSSSATVYGTPKHVPLKEEDDIGGTTNPYGTTKLIIEGILQDVYKVNQQMNVIILRYFNPIGAHKSGLIGEDPNGIPNNLMPYITQVAVGKLKELGVFGNDYKTHDGTGVRDYIHVVDLALGHVAALKKMEENKGLLIYNLGTGKGSSVLDMVKAFETANNIKIPYVIKERRPGDVDANYADCSKALKEMGWKAKYDIVDACKDSWNWQSHNKNGYEE
ncbi:MAG: UDP-glucose 4-epimerase GalE [Bacilli bacterium]|nr:UDP-glucose 4-epimerase GalE [Bacilli bacterium]